MSRAPPIMFIYHLHFFNLSGTLPVFLPPSCAVLVQSLAQVRSLSVGSGYAQFACLLDSSSVILSNVSR